MSFDAQFALSTIVPLAQTAYDPAFLPKGNVVSNLPPWEIVAKIEPENFGYILRGAIVRDGVLLTIVAIAFAGTRDEEQWLRDLDARPVPALYGGQGNVHRGFQNQYSIIHTSLWAGLHGLYYDELWIIGHSLGGALAILAAGELRARKPKVWTLEGPRTAFFDWAPFFDQAITECWCICNWRDVIWHLPGSLVASVTSARIYRSTAVSR